MSGVVVGRGEERSCHAAILRVVLIINTTGGRRGGSTRWAAPGILLFVFFSLSEQLRQMLVLCYCEGTEYGRGFSRCVL